MNILVYYPVNIYKPIWITNESL